MTPIAGSHGASGPHGRVGPPPNGPGAALLASDVLAASPLAAAFRGTVSPCLPPDDRATGLPSIAEVAADLDAAEIAIQP